MPATMLWDCSSASPFEVSGRMDACVHWTMPLIPAAVLSMPVAVLLMPTTMLLMIMVLRSIQAQVGLMPAAMPWDCPLLPTTFAVFRNGGGPTVTSLPVDSGLRARAAPPWFPLQGLLLTCLQHLPFFVVVTARPLPLCRSGGGLWTRAASQ